MIEAAGKNGLRGEAHGCGRNGLRGEAHGCGRALRPVAGARDRLDVLPPPSASSCFVWSFVGLLSVTDRDVDGQLRLWPRL